MYIFVNSSVLHFFPSSSFLSLFFFFFLPFCLFLSPTTFSPGRKCSPTYQQDSPSTLNQINFLIFHSKASRPLLLMWINCINVQLILCHLLFTLRMRRANMRTGGGEGREGAKRNRSEIEHTVYLGCKCYIFFLLELVMCSWLSWQPVYHQVYREEFCSLS